MARLATGLFYTRRHAERAVETLRERGISPDQIYLEAEVLPPGVSDYRRDPVMQAEQERRFAGLQVGLIIGLALGFLAGLGITALGSAIAEMARSAPPGAAPTNLLITSPVLAALICTVAGGIAGALVGLTVDFTLNRIGAGPALPSEETLVTVRTDEQQVRQVCGLLFEAGAKHVHVAERADDERAATETPTAPAASERLAA